MDTKKRECSNESPAFRRGEDQNQAKYWYEQAAKQGSAEAQYCPGVMYANGVGLPQNDRKAKKLLEQAAKQDHIGAKFRLDLMYALSEGI